MTPPLPDELQLALTREGNGPGSGHRGLWYDKFCNQWAGAAWTMKAGPDDAENPKLAWIKTVAGRTGVAEELSAYGRRLYDLICAQDGQAVVVKAQSRFVTGLGRSHPVENGLAWHPTLGTPYLPGSSAKGLTRAWARLKEQGELDRLLGEGDRAGAVAVLDAVPLRPVFLEADVLTPHYAGWTDGDVPGDWRSPTPIPFLAVAAEMSLLCGVVPLRPAGTADARTVLDWLITALDEHGAGAKTAVGYGHFQVDQNDSTLAGWREDRRQREAIANPEGAVAGGPRGP